MLQTNKRSKLADIKSVFKLIESAWTELQKTTAPVAVVEGSLVSENKVDESGVMDRNCDKLNNGEHKNTSENQILEEVEENLTTNNDNVDESKENVPKMSKKELKKQKKRQKYLLELESEEKNNCIDVNNTGCAMEVEENASEVNEKINKKSKKAKKTKVEPYQANSHDNRGIEQMEAMTEETASKKKKKRKLVDPVPEIAEKKNKFDCFEGLFLICYLNIQPACTTVYNSYF